MAIYNLVPQYFENLVKLKIIAKKIEKQSAYARGSDAIVTSNAERTEWTFLAPNDIQETVNHSWEPYESVASRLATKVGEVTNALTDLQATGGAVSSSFKSVGSSSSTTASNKALGLANAAVAGAKDVAVPSFRVDASLVYKNTNRREYSVTLNVVDMYGDPYNNVFVPIRKLEELSCPEMTDDSIGINFPNIFQIYTINSDMIKINNCAIVSIAPTWKGPYINDYATMCELTINFKDIEPMYRRSFSQGGIIRTS